MRKRIHWLSGFTLVELIVVITILAILATIGLVSLQGYAWDARDSVRVTDMNALQRMLVSRFNTDMAYPMPDSAVSVTASGYQVGFQGYAGPQVLYKVGMGKVRDPLDGMQYTYSVNANASKYQILGFLEGYAIADSGVPTAYASVQDFSSRHPRLLGDQLGIVLKGKSVPLQFDGTNVDLVTATGTYAIQFTDTQKTEGTGSVLRAWIGWGGLVGYWNFDEISGNVVKDSSGNASDGIFSGSMIPVRNAWKIGTALDFTSNSGMTSASGGYVDFGSLKSLASTQAGTPHSISSWIRVSRPLCTDTNACRQWVALLGSPGTGSHHWLVGWLHGPTQFWVWSGPQIKGFSYDPGTWMYVTMTFDGTNLIGYLNGERIPWGSTSTSSTSFNLQDSHFVVGGGVMESPFDGKLDELRVYSRALTDAEVKILYDTSK